MGARTKKKVAKKAMRRTASRSAKKSSHGSIKLDIHRRVLPNGLTLIANRNPTAPTIAISCQIDIGRLQEKPEEAGIVSLIGRCLDEGTQKYSGDKLAEYVDGLGGGLYCSGSGATVQFAAEDAKAGVNVLAEVIRRPTFPAIGVRRAKSLQIADLESELANPGKVAGRRFRELCYGDHPFARHSYGDIVTVTRATPAKLRAFHKKWFKPDAARIVAVGDRDPEEMLDMLSRAFSSWRGTSTTLEYPEPAPHPDAAVSEHIEFDRQQLHVYLGHLGIARTDEDFYKAVILDNILGSGPGFTSRIARKLRDEKGLCYSVFAGMTHSAGVQPGLFTAYIGTSPGQEGEAIAGFLKEMNEIRSSLATKREIADVKAYLTGSFVWRFERNTSRAGFIHGCERFGLGDDYAARYPDLIESVRASDVRDCAQRLLMPDNYYCVTIGKLGKVPKAVGKARKKTRKQSRR